ncbi:GntR family transcriptional regulator [Rhizobium gallicum]|uniref:GntR family transcriptional regulator n=1 Tax=Rhizobium gallicum TaxID=56730 RepID=UPI000A6F208C|nr:GntR family transcriptional regulator [Rhizobium gallicum]
MDTNAIFETLRYRISTLQYPPGSALKEIQLSEEFSVSRTPIRQALQRLELVGLVQPVVGHGTIVTGIDLASMRHLLQYRLNLAKILDQFLEMSDPSEGLALLRQSLEANTKLASKFDSQRFAEISHDVRWTVWKHISNPFMAQSWIDTYYLASRVWFICLPYEQNRFLDLQAQEIDLLIQAFERSDPKAVAAVVHDTLRSWITEIWRSISEGRSPIDMT